MKYESSFMCNGMFMCIIVYIDDVLLIDICRYICKNLMFFFFFSY